MKCAAAKLLLDELDITVKNMVSLGAIDKNAEAYLARYLLVRISGIYEEAIERIIDEMASRAKHSQLRSYTQKSIKYGFQNPKSDNIVKTLEKFDPAWAAAVSGTHNKHKVALDNIITHKNNIAHGEIISPITIRDAVGFYNDSKIIIETIDRILL